MATIKRDIYEILTKVGSSDDIDDVFGNEDGDVNETITHIEHVVRKAVDRENTELTDQLWYILKSKKKSISDFF